MARVGRSESDAARAKGPFFFNGHHLNNVTHVLLVAFFARKIELVPEAGQSVRRKRWRSVLPLHDMRGTATAQMGGTPPGISLFRSLSCLLSRLFDTDVCFRHFAHPTGFTYKFGNLGTHRAIASPTHRTVKSNSRRPTARPSHHPTRRLQHFRSLSVPSSLASGRVEEQEPRLTRAGDPATASRT